MHLVAASFHLSCDLFIIKTTYEVGERGTFSVKIVLQNGKGSELG